MHIQDLEAVGHLSELTETDPDAVQKSLLFRTVATGGGEVIEKGHSAQEACFSRDAFAKVPPAPLFGGVGPLLSEPLSL